MRLIRIVLLGLGLVIVLLAIKIVWFELTIEAEPYGEAFGEVTNEQQSEPSLGDSEALKTALAAYRRGDDAKAVTELRACVEKEAGLQRAACQSLLAELHFVGAGVMKNLTEARALLQSAADVGEPEAQFMLAMLYGTTFQPGDDLHHLQAQAILHLYAASTSGHTGALMAMGYRHMHGYGVPQACSTAALNYINVAKKITGIYSAGMPQAVELVRLNLHQKDRKVISSSEMNLFVQIATSGDSTVAAAIGKRYLLGIEGFKQDYRKAYHYLRLAANRNHPGAQALLGYMYCLGLGIPQNKDTAYSYFVTAAAQNDALGHNGLGYIYFHGTNTQSRNMRMAFKHFNESAYGNSADGMYNLANMYLTGTGVEQNFHKAVLYYTHALDRGHTPAAYSLAVMHLNGIGTVRDCDIAVNLLKKVCERGEWVSSKLVEAYDHGDKQPDRAALLFLKLAEAGHEVAQMNVAHLFDMGQSSLLFPGSAEGSGDELRKHGRALAQRYYELSAEQGSASSELRLGDYAYYGWGLQANFKETDHEEGQQMSGEGAAEDTLPLPPIYTNHEVELMPQPVDYESSLARYRKTAEMTVTGEWMQSFVARASFNLAFMHQFGLGVAQDMHMAKQHYFRCQEVDPHGLHMPVALGLLSLTLHMTYLRLPPLQDLVGRLTSDVRVHLLLLHVVSLAVLVCMRVRFDRPRRPPRPAHPPVASTAEGAASAPAPTTPVSGGIVLH